MQIFISVDPPEPVDLASNILRSFELPRAATGNEEEERGRDRGRGVRRIEPRVRTSRRRGGPFKRSVFWITHSGQRRYKVTFISRSKHIDRPPQTITHERERERDADRV